MRFTMKVVVKRENEPEICRVMGGEREKAGPMASMRQRRSYRN